MHNRWRMTLVVICLVAGLRAAPPATAAQAHGPDLAGIDPASNPGDDFYAYANGSWMKTVIIPEDRSSYGTGAMVAERTEKRTAKLIQGLTARRDPKGSEARKIADYYTSFMDEATIEALGLSPLKPTLDSIAALQDRKGLARMLGSTLRADVDALNSTNFYTDNILGLWIAQDLDQPSRYSPFLLQGGLGMPDRDYYLDPSPRMAAFRTEYQAHIVRVLGLSGTPDAETKAARIFALELRIAQTHASREASSEVTQGNNHWTRQDFASRAPGLDWPSYFAASGLGSREDFVVWHPSAITGISALAASEPLETWKDYLVFHALDHHAPYLSKAFVEEHFAFHGKVLSGTPQMPTR